MYIKGKEEDMATSTMIYVRIDGKIKKEATETLGDMGLSVSDAVRVFLAHVVAEKQFPFTLKVPNPTTRRAMKEADGIIGSERARYQNGSELIGDLESGPFAKSSDRRKRRTQEVGGICSEPGTGSPDDGTSGKPTGMKARKNGRITGIALANGR